LPWWYCFRSHLLTARKQLTEELSQTQQVILSYHSLGEEFTVLSQQYRELQEEIENRQWALRELSKSRT
jgi:predicted nucleic acid-binding protein